MKANIETSRAIIADAFEVGAEGNLHMHTPHTFAQRYRILLTLIEQPPTNRNTHVQM